MAKEEKIIDLSDKLKGSYYETFDKISFYFYTSSLDEYLITEVLTDILDILLSAQERGESTENIIGSDYKKFCDEILKEAKTKSTRRIFKSILDLLFAVFFYIFMRSLNSFGSFNGSFTSLRLQLSYLDVIIMLGIIIACFLLSYFLHKKSFSDYKETYLFLIPLFIVVFIFAMVYFIFPNYQTHILLNVSMLGINAVLAASYFGLKYYYKKLYIKS